MKANAERIEKNTVLLEVEVEAELFSKAVDKAYRNVVKKVNVPGFRKGKTPRNILERYIGKEALYEEAMGELVPDAYMDAVKDTGIEPVDQPKVELVQVEEGKPVVFKATVIVKPEVELGRYKELEVTKEHYSIEEEDVQRELNQLQDNHAKLLTLEEGDGAVVINGDVAVIDYLGKLNGEPFSGGEGNNYSLGIGSNSFIPGFEDQIIGMSINETKDIQVTFPENYQNSELAGQEAVFTVTVHSIQRKELSPLDDEFAKDVSELDTLEELREDIKNRLIQAAESKAKFQLRRQLIDQVVDNAVAEIPDSMIEQQTKEMFTSIGNNFARQGFSVEDYLNYTNSSVDKMREEMRPEAEHTVKTSLVMEAIGKAEGITATEEEIQSEIEKIAAAYRQEPEEFRAAIENEGSIAFITDNIIREKTIQFLVDNNKIIEDSDVQAE